MDIYSSFFITAKTWKQLICPGEWINKTVVHPDNEILFSTKKRNELSDHENTWMKLKCILLNERSQSEKGYIPYNANYMTFWKRLDYGHSNKIRS